MRNLGVIFSMIVLPFFALGQETKMTSGVGYAIASINSLNKKELMLCKELAFGLEVPIRGQLLYLDFSIGLRNLLFEKTDSAGQNILIRQSYLMLPVSMARYYYISMKSSFYWAFGLNAGYLFYIDEGISNQAILPGNTDVGEYSIGVNGVVGFKTKINKLLSFSVGYSAAKDLWKNVNNAGTTIRMERRLISISFRINLK